MTVIFFALIAALGMAAAYKPFANLPRNLKTDSIIKIIGGTFASLSLVGASFDPTHLSIKPATVYAVQESAFQGSYNDPNHPGCLRKISAVGNAITIVGSDSPDGGNQWVLQATENVPGKILVDFSPKGGPKDLLGLYDANKNAISWPDGNSWTKKI